MEKKQELKETTFKGNEINITVQTPIVKKINTIVYVVNGVFKIYIF